LSDKPEKKAGRKTTEMVVFPACANNFTGVVFQHLVSWRNALRLILATGQSKQAGTGNRHNETRRAIVMTRAGTSFPARGMVSPFFY